MRILVVTQYFWPENFRVNDLVQELAKRGNEIIVLTGKPTYPSQEVFASYLENPEKYQDYNGVEICRVPMLARGRGTLRLFMNYLSFVFGAGLWGPWKLRKHKFDVVFIFEPSPVTVGLPGILLGRLKRAPVVFWVLDLWPETLSALGIVRSKLILGWVGKLVSYIYNRCSIVLGQSRAFIPNIAKYCSDDQKIHYFPNWAEDIYHQEDSEKANEIAECSNIFTLMFAGNIGEAQDFPAILRAAEILKGNDINIRWLIVGDGRMSEWLMSEVQKRGLEDNVILLGRHPIERMPSFYAHADALLVSLKSDPVFSLTIPGKVQSYLMSGIPIIAMLDGEAASVIKRAGAGFTCAAGDYHGLASIITEMTVLTDEQRLLLGQNGRKYAKSEFDREILINKLENLFNEAVAMHPHNS